MICPTCQGMFNSNLSKEVPAAMQRAAGQEHQLPADREGSASSATSNGGEDALRNQRRKAPLTSQGRSPEGGTARVAKRPKQTDVVEHPQVFRHIGFATGEPTSSRPVRSQCSHPTGSMAWVVKR